MIDWKACVRKRRLLHDKSFSQLQQRTAARVLTPGSNSDFFFWVRQIQGATLCHHVTHFVCIARKQKIKATWGDVCRGYMRRRCEGDKDERVREKGWWKRKRGWNALPLRDKKKKKDWLVSRETTYPHLGSDQSWESKYLNVAPTSPIKM